MELLVLVALVVVAAWTAVVAGMEHAERQTIKRLAKRSVLALVVGGIAVGFLANEFLGDGLVAAVVGTLAVYFLDRRFNWSDTPTWNT